MTRGTGSAAAKAQICAGLWLDLIRRRCHVSNKQLIHLLQADAGWTRRLLQNGCPDQDAACPPGWPDPAWAALQRLQQTVGSDLQHQAAALQARQIGIAIYGTSDFPAQLQSLSACPALLFHQGNVRLMQGADHRLDTIVGTRKASAYGREVTRRIARSCVRSGIVVCSGLALGIDAEAHRATLAAGGQTIAVLGSGLDWIYPSQHRQLADRIRQSGLLISEYAPGTPPRRHQFPARNRILAGLAERVIVTEAGLTSGALITADFAADQNRSVYAVPGSVLTAGSQGCHRLIREGAELFDNLQFEPRPSGCNAAGKPDAAVPEELELIQQLARQPLDLFSLAQALPDDLSGTALRLLRLEARGLVKQVKDRYELTDSGLMLL